MYGTVVGSLPSVQASSPGRRRLRQVVVDVSAGAVAFLVVGVVSVSFSLATFGETHSQLVGSGSRMALAGIVVVGAVELALSRAPFMIVCPDLFVCPMLADLGRSVAGEGGETYVAAAVVATGCAGVALAAAGQSPLLRLGDFMPFPIVCGLLGAVGVVLLRQSYAIATVVVVAEEVASDECPARSAVALYAPAVAFGVAVVGLNCKFGANPTRSVLPVLAISIASFYASALWLSRDTGVEAVLLEARACGFLFDPRALGGGTVLAWAGLGDVGWGALATVGAAGRIVALCLLVVVKSSLIYPAWERAFRDDAVRPLDVGRELAAAGLGNAAAAVVGSFGAQPQLSTAVSLREMGASPRSGVAQAAAVALCAVVWVNVDGASPLAVVPKFAFAGLLIAQGWTLVSSFVIEPCLRPPRALSAAEAGVVLAILVVFVRNGMLAGLSVGAQLAVVVFAIKSRVGVFKYHGSSALQRSTTQRSAFDARHLDEDGHLVQILRLQGLLYWGNATQLVRSIRVLVLDGVDDLRRPPRFVVLDLTLVLDLDASAADAAVVVYDLCRSRACDLVLAGLDRPVRDRVERAGLGLRDLSTDDARASFLLAGDDADRTLRPVWIAEHLDDALSLCEDALLRAYEASLSPRSSPPGGDGFGRVLRTIARRCGPAFVDTQALGRIAPLTRLARFEPGDRLDERDGRRLVFVESGVVSIRREPDQAPTTCLGWPHDDSSPVFRLVRLGPGGVVGIPDLFSGRTSIGAKRAETKCVAHLLDFEAIALLHQQDPALCLELYKTLAHLLALAYDERTEKFARTLDMVQAVPRSELIPPKTRYRAERAVLGTRTSGEPSRPRCVANFPRTVLSIKPLRRGGSLASIL